MDKGKKEFIMDNSLSEFGGKGKRTTGRRAPTKKQIRHYQSEAMNVREKRGLINRGNTQTRGVKPKEENDPLTNTLDTCCLETE